MVSNIATPSTWATELSDSFQNIFWGIIQYLPNVVVAVIIFVVGWLIGVGVGRVVAQIVNSLRIDQALRSTGIEHVLSRAGFELNAGKFLGFFVKWFFIIVFLVAALQVLGLTQVNDFLMQVLGYLPHVIAAVLILLIAAVIAAATGRVVMGSAKAASLHAAGFLGKVASYSIWALAILVALDQLNVATAFVQTFFTGVVIAFSLAIGLSFGLGGQASAARYLEHLQSDIKE
jgi:small-conductance mechanosensitive channel